jgi:hypothetical protein
LRTNSSGAQSRRLSSNTASNDFAPLIHLAPE